MIINYASLGFTDLEPGFSSNVVRLSVKYLLRVAGDIPFANYSFIYV